MLQELMQHYVLASLSRAGMFSDAAFHGGTCLRIIHGMNRFSEDLDFLLKRPDPGFGWREYLEALEGDFTREGIRLEAQDKSSMDAVVRKAGKILLLVLPFETL